MVLTNSKLETYVNRMMKEKGVSSYELKVEGNSKPGTNGFTGHIAFFTVTTKPDGKLYNLVLKLAQNENKFQKEITDINFERELFIYSNVVPTIQSHFSRKLNSVMNYIPELFWYSYTEDEYILVFVDLQKKGFSMIPKEKPLDLEQTKVILRLLARYHAEVMTFRHQKPEIFNGWIAHLNDIRFWLMRKFDAINALKVDFGRLFEVLKKQGEDDYAEKFSKMFEDVEKYLKPANESDRIVINHGDCWINNVFLKFDKSTPKECRFFDFQFSSYGTPVEDLSFFLFTACDRIVLKHFNELMQDYYSTFSKNVKILGSDPEEIFTFSQLETHWKKYGAVGLICAVMVVKLLNLEEEETQIFMNSITGDEAAKEKARFLMIKNHEVFYDRLAGVFVEYGKQFLD